MALMSLRGRVADYRALVLLSPMIAFMVALVAERVIWAAAPWAGLGMIVCQGRSRTPFERRRGRDGKGRA